MDEKGYIKFNCRWTRAPAPGLCRVQELNRWRVKLFAAGMIGATPEGVGYGNLSIRLQGNEFIITGAGTGKIDRLTTEHFTRVNAFDIRANMLSCEGPLQASSESLTHAAVYVAAQEANAVFHVHHTGLWNKYLHRLPSTPPEVEYGTPEMGGAVMDLLQDPANRKKGVIVMSGHEGGLISFGTTPDEAGEEVMGLIIDNV